MQSVRPSDAAHLAPDQQRSVLKLITRVTRLLSTFAGCKPTPISVMSVVRNSELTLTFAATADPRGASRCNTWIICMSIVRRQQDTTTFAGTISFHHTLDWRTSRFDCGHQEERLPSTSHSAIITVVADSATCIEPPRLRKYLALFSMQPERPSMSKCQRSVAHSADSVF